MPNQAIVSDETRIYSLSDLKSRQCRGQLLRPIMLEKVQQLEKLKLDSMFIGPRATVPIIFVDETDTTMVVLEGNHRFCLLSKIETCGDYADIQVPCRVFCLDRRSFKRAFKNLPSLNYSDICSPDWRRVIDKSKIPRIVRKYSIKILTDSEKYQEFAKFNDNEALIAYFEFFDNQFSGNDVLELRSNRKLRKQEAEKLIAEGWMPRAEEGSVDHLTLYCMAPNTRKVIRDSLQTRFAWPTGCKIFQKIYNTSQTNDQATADALLEYKNLRINAGQLKDELQTILDAKPRSERSVILTENRGDATISEVVSWDDVPQHGFVFVSGKIPEQLLILVNTGYCNVVCLDPNADVYDWHGIVIGKVGGGSFNSPTLKCPYIVGGIDVIRHSHRGRKTIFQKFLQLVIAWTTPDREPLTRVGTSFPLRSYNVVYDKVIPKKRKNAMDGNNRKCKKSNAGGEGASESDSETSGED